MSEMKNSYVAEPVAWQSLVDGRWILDAFGNDPEMRKKAEEMGVKFRALYTEPPAWETAEIDFILDAGQGDDDGMQIMPDFEPGMSTAAKVEACVLLLEKRRDVIEGLLNGKPTRPAKAVGEEIGNEMADGAFYWVKVGDDFFVLNWRADHFWGTNGDGYLPSSVEVLTRVFPPDIARTALKKQNAR